MPDQWQRNKQADYAQRDKGTWQGRTWQGDARDKGTGFLTHFRHLYLCPANNTSV